MEWKPYRLRDGLQWESAMSAHQFETGEQRVRLDDFGASFHMDEFDVLFVRDKDMKGNEKIRPRAQIVARRKGWDNGPNEEIEVRVSGERKRTLLLPVRDFLVLFEPEGN